jgi:hypothetical protein
MAEIRPYKQNYFASRKKIFFIISLILVAVAAVLSVLFFRSAASQDIYAGKVVRISGSTDDIGLVKTFREGKSISYFSRASGFKDLVFHRFVGDYAIKIIARDTGEYLEKVKRESQAEAAPRAAEPNAEVPSSLPPPVNIIAGEEGTLENAPGKNEGPAGAEMPAAAPSETAREDDAPVPGYAGMREEGLLEYDRQVSELALKADEIDSLWQKHRDFCQGTIAVMVGNAYGREWFGIYTTINAADTPECKMMIQDMQNLAAAIDAGMEAAWEKAHRAGVYPGQIRASQQKYRMELDRWNK